MRLQSSRPMWPGACISLLPAHYDSTLFRERWRHAAAFHTPAAALGSAVSGGRRRAAWRCPR
jgi:hypothetical protein